MKCSQCGHAMNHHADKLQRSSTDTPDDAAELIQAYCCPHCGWTAARYSEEGPLLSDAV
jgi:hypothetical protein